LDDKEVVRGDSKKVTEHYVVKLEKGNQKKTLYYSSTGSLLTNKP
jgi:hypothetical protein